MQQEVTKNNEFYQNCTQYFEFLRKKSTVDYDFEDEYYFTMPAISSHQQYNNCNQIVLIQRKRMEKISEEERKMRIDFIKNLIRDNKTDLTRLEKELQELLDLDPLKQDL